MFPRSLPACTALVLAAGLALSGPAAAGLLDDPVELAQATPATPAAPAPAAGGHDHRQRAAMNPKAICLDMLARRIGNRTYMKVKLELKPEQMAAWDAFAKAAEGADTRETARCNALPAELKQRPNAIDRLTMQEGAMKARLERIEAVKPSMTALYNALSPEQKTVLDRPMSGMMGHGMMGGGMGGGGMGRTMGR